MKIAWPKEMMFSSSYKANESFLSTEGLYDNLIIYVFPTQLTLFLLSAFFPWKNIHSYPIFPPGFHRNLIVCIYYHQAHHFYLIIIAF